MEKFCKSIYYAKRHANYADISRTTGISLCRVIAGNFVRSPWVLMPRVLVAWVDRKKDWLSGISRGRFLLKESTVSDRVKL